MVKFEFNCIKSLYTKTLLSEDEPLAYCLYINKKYSWWYYDENNLFYY